MTVSSTRGRIGIALVAAVLAGACGRPDAPPSGTAATRQSSSASSNGANATSPPPNGPARQAADDPLSGLLAALDPKEHALEPWPLEPVPPDWNARSVPQIPLVAGFTEIVAVQEPRGDYESMAHADSVLPDRIAFAFSLKSGAVSGVTSMRTHRTVFTRDMAAAHGYRMTFSETDAESFPGTTAIGISSAVFRDLERAGRSHIDLQAGVDAVAAMLAAADALPSDLTGDLVRNEASPVGFPVLVNGRRVWLPALHASGEFKGMVRTVPAEFWFLADARNAMTLRAAIDRARIQVVRIDFPEAERTSALEKALAEHQPVEMWGVYFESGSAQLQPESGAVLDTVAEVLRRHPDWRLRIEGHTDGIGSDTDNQTLSEQRAEAVRAELVHRLGTGGDRLDAAGYGESRPRESNETLSGRARNRRVELLRR